MKNTHFINVKDGKGKDLFKDLPDGRYRVDVSSYSRRSNPQNAYYWGCVIPMIGEKFKELGYDLNSQEVHDYLKGEFNKAEVLIDDVVLEVPKSTAALSKTEFGEYLEKVQRFAADTLGIYIPDPNQQLVFNH